MFNNARLGHGFRYLAILVLFTTTTAQARLNCNPETQVEGVDEDNLPACLPKNNNGTREPTGGAATSKPGGKEGDQGDSKKDKEGDPATGDRSQAPPTADEGPLTIYDPNSPQNIEKQRQQADLLRREEEVRRRENAVRDAQNAQLQEERSVGHVRPGGYDNNFVPDQVYQQGPIIDPSVAERLLAVKALAQDPRIPAALGNQVITLLLNIDPQFNNVGPIVAQAEKILEANGANKKLFADVVDANKVTAKTENLIVDKQEKTTTTNNNNGKAYRQDELIVKVPTDILAGGEKNIAKGGNVNMLVVTPKGGSAGGQGGSGNSGGAKNLGNQSLADELLAGLVLRQEDAANPSRKNPVINRGIASAEGEAPLMPAPRLAPVEAPRSKRIGILLMLVAAIGAGFLLFGKLKKRSAAMLAKDEKKSEPTAEPHAPEQATSATKIAPKKSQKP